MKVSFIVPLYNCLHHTQAMLASLRATVPATVEHEVILADDFSSDGTRAWLAGIGDSCRVVLNERNLGFAATCNRGAAIARGELLFFLNNDLLLQPRWLEPMLAAFARFPDAGLVGNVQRHATTGAIDHTGLYFDHKGKPAHDRHGWRTFADYRRVVAVTGACFGIRAAVWRQLNGFDEAFRNGCEDVDLGLRARAAGFQHYVALRSVVRHHVSASLGRKLRDEENTRRLFLRWRATIVDLAAPAWCRAYLAAQAEQSYVYDYALVRTALAHCFRTAPADPLLRAAVDRSLQLELDRWSELLR
jgi:O-antigen biosynthesis protein